MLFNQIEQLAKVAAFQVQDKMKREALDRGELYMPRKRPGIGPTVVANAFWQAHQTYWADRSLSEYQPEPDDDERDPFKRMLSAVSRDVLHHKNGRAPPEDDIHVMRSILGLIFSYRKNGKFDPESEVIAVKLGLVKEASA